MGSTASTRSRITLESIRQRIQQAEVTDTDKNVLEDELAGLIGPVHFTIEEAARWMAVSIETRESTMPERAAVEREVDDIFAQQQS